MIGSPYISICIPTFNRGNYLDVLLSGLEDLMDLDMQIVISDNASEDLTKDICFKYIKKGFPIKYVRNSKNLGPDLNFMNAVSCADGEYCILVGDDDKIDVQAFRSICNYLALYMPSVLMAARTVCDVNLNPTGFETRKIEKYDVARLYDFKYSKEIFEYFSENKSLIGIFSYISCFFFRRNLWNAASTYNLAIGSAYIHVWKILDVLIAQKGNILDCPVSVVYTRLGNDGFLERLGGSIMKRFELDHRGYAELAIHFFGNNKIMKKAFLAPIHHRFAQNGFKNFYIDSARKLGMYSEVELTLNLLEIENK